ncbi:histidine phosphatase family protein (plasmid) [Sphingobium sp. SJ10-10]|uniref:histidine phosphatase family protein n=1 Tax=Sphingobium sp. SJ10-10 TaxID=3114999 RepID=UPI002E18BD28|nr:histidine phosphatase family protein [Sphingobium sp. SJ10-10]
MTVESDTHGHRQVANAQKRFALPQGARQIILVRHGSSVGPTLETVELGTLTITNPPLAEDGHAQAEAVGRALADTDIAAIFVTPLQRTRQTADPLVQAVGIAPIVVDDLREVHMGDFEHSFYEHAAARHPIIDRMFVEETWEVIPNAESATHFADRVQRGIRQVLDACGGGETAVLFSHAGTIAEICRQATGSRAFAFMGVENASLSRLIVRADGSWQLRSFNEVSHLP